MLLNKISQTEFEIIDEYRRAYVGLNGVKTKMDNFISSQQLLKTWEKYKSWHLDRLFGNELIIKKSIEYSKPQADMVEEMTYDTICDDFRTDFYNYCIKDQPYEIADALTSLLRVDYLVTNSYDGITFSIPLPNGKDYIIKSGTKLMRIFNKLSNAFGIPSFEAFRIRHSQIVNDKNIKGELVLSIHPLDYMTMSDNDCGWDSCMSWIVQGDYRLGTVEMMNSPTVVVAYITSSTPMHLPGGHSWNSKKWRQLFIVDENFLGAVKGYPYQNDCFTEEAFYWLKDLAKNNLGWTYLEPERRAFDEDHNFLIPGISDLIWLHFEYEYMYNDFGTLANSGGHLIALGTNITENDLFTEFGSCRRLLIDYSGPAQCMICGEVNPDFSEGNSLACTDCEVVFYCDECHEFVPFEEINTLNNHIYCDNCYSNLSICANCDTVVVQTDTINLYIYNTNNKGLLTLESFCCEDCLKKYIAQYFKSDVTIENMGDYRTAIVTDLNEEGKKFYNLV